MVFLENIAQTCSRKISLRNHGDGAVCKGFYDLTGNIPAFLLVIKENPSLLKLLQYGAHERQACAPLIVNVIDES